MIAEYSCSITLAITVILSLMVIAMTIVGVTKDGRTETDKSIAKYVNLNTPLAYAIVGLSVASALACRK